MPTGTCIGGGVVPTDGAQSVDEESWSFVAVIRARSLNGRHRTDPEIRITRSGVPQWASKSATRKDGKEVAGRSRDRVKVSIKLSDDEGQT